MAVPRSLRFRYYAYRVTNSAGLYLPVAIIYLQDRGFGLGFIGFAYAVYAFGTLAAEIPTGYLGDLLGRRESLALGHGLRVVVLAAYPFAASAAATLLLHVVWATGRSFHSGTHDAWLYELLVGAGEADEFTRVHGRGSSALLVVSAAGALVGAVLYTVDPTAPFIANAALIGLGIPMLARFPATSDDRADAAPEAAAPGDETAPDGTIPEERPATDVFTVGDAARLLRVQARRPGIRWFVVYAALFHAVFVVTRVYEQPALDAVGVPVAGLGVLYAAFKLVSAGAAASAGWLHDRLGVRGVFAGLVPLYALAYAGIAVLPQFVIPVLFLNRGLATVTTPVRNQYLNDRLDDVGRATVLSGAAMALAAVGGLARVAAGFQAAALGPVMLLPWVGVPIAVAGGLFWLWRPPVGAGPSTGPSTGCADAAD